MSESLAFIVKFCLVALSSVFFLVDPFAVIPAFLSMTPDDTPADRQRTARRAALTCFIVLAVFAAAGGLIFKVFGITLAAFKIAGGVILIMIGLEMLQARKSGTKQSPEEAAEGAAREAVGVIPLGIPMLAGPGAISTVMILTGDSRHWWQFGVIFAVIALTSLISYWILAAADRVGRYLGETGIRILTRLMGLLLTAVAVQFIINGLTDLGMIRVPGNGR
ncbi:MAG TPA: MarC family protein [Terriglobia bacterium]